MYVCVCICCALDFTLVHLNLALLLGDNYIEMLFVYHDFEMESVLTVSVKIGNPLEIKSNRNLI